MTSNSHTRIRAAAARIALIAAVAALGVISGCADQGSEIVPPSSSQGAGAGSIAALVPERTVIGDTVTVAGSGFGDTQGPRQVLFSATDGGTVPAPVDSMWSSDTIRVIVPAGAVDGLVVVRNGTDKSNALPFEVAPVLVHYAAVESIFGYDPPEGFGCYGCHGFVGPGVGDFLNDTYEHLMSGTSDHGPVVWPRHGAQSVIVKKLRGTAGFGTIMPPPGESFPGPPVPDAEIQALQDWIDQGARND